VTDSRPNTQEQSIMMIAWRSECYRSNTTADLFGADLKLIWPEVGNGPVGKAVRYALSFWLTFWLVLLKRPKFAIVMNLPAFAPMAAQLAALVSGTDIILDFHSGGITSKFWSRFTPLFRFIAKRAPFVICHNRVDGAVIEKWGGKPFYLTALPSNFDGTEYLAAPGNPTVLVICSFKDDEPIDVLLGAMKSNPDVLFQVTGNYRKAGLSSADMPQNVELLGFVPYGDYIQRMCASSAIITVSDRDYIMQAAVHEALSLGVPVITNRSQTIESVLEDAGTYAEVDIDSLAIAVSTAVSNSQELRERTIARKEFLRNELAQNMKQALSLQS
tara:strand:- start:8 stop:997 length:990 start_codon:yes stop_codon:yes gene_type:complete